MCLNQDVRKHKDASSVYYILPTYDEATLECAQTRQYSSVWTILGLLNAINTTMNVVYPCVNGTMDLSFTNLNMKLRPKDPVSKRPIKTMWSSTLSPVPGQIWRPNHSVPIAPKSAVTETKTNTSQRLNFAFNTLKSRGSLLKHLMCCLQG